MRYPRSTRCRSPTPWKPSSSQSPSPAGQCCRPEARNSKPRPPGYAPGRPLRCRTFWREGAPSRCGSSASRGPRRWREGRVCGWRRPRPRGLRLAHGAPALLLGGCLPLSNTSYMRPAEWPPSMHKCAMGPGAAPCSQGVIICAIAVQRRARTQFDTPVNEGPPMERVAGHYVSHCHKARMRDCQERRGGQPLLSWPGCRGSAPPGCRGSAPLATPRFHPTTTVPRETA
jgi:hypothetical protein